MQQPSWCGVPRIRQWMVVVWLALGLIVSAAGVAHAQQTINPTGGKVGSDFKIEVDAA